MLASGSESTMAAIAIAVVFFIYLVNVVIIFGTFFLKVVVYLCCFYYKGSIWRNYDDFACFTKNKQKKL